MRVYLLIFVLSAPGLMAAPMSLSSQDAVSMAMRESHKLKDADSERDAAAARSRGAVSSFLPRLDLSLAAGSNRAYEVDPDSTLPLSEREKEEVEYNQYKGTLKLTQPLFTGLDSYYQLRLRNSERDYADIKLDDTRDEVTRQTLEWYFGIQLHLEELAAENEVRQQRESYLKDVRAQMEQGRTTRLFFLQAEYAVRSQEPVIKRIEAELAKKRVQLFRLLNLPVDTVLVLNESLEQGFAAVKAMKRLNLEESYKAAMQTNRGILMARSQLDQVEYEAGRAQSTHLPRLDLVLTAGVDTRYREEINQNDARKYTAELQLNVPLFSGFESFATRSERIARREQANERLLESQDGLLTQINDLYRQWDLNNTVLEAEQANLKLAEESIKNAENLFQVGRATVNDVLDSYARKLAAKRGIAATKHAQILLAIDTQRAVGQK